MTEELTARDIEVVDNPEQHRYEARVAGQLVAMSVYRAAGKRLIFTHTEVMPAAEGRGVGSRLVAGALDDVRARGLTITVHCPFVRAFLARNPAYRDLVAESPSETTGQS